jgi:hypothetical protein
LVVAPEPRLIERKLEWSRDELVTQVADECGGQPLLDSDRRREKTLVRNSEPTSLKLFHR